MIQKKLEVIKAGENVFVSALLQGMLPFFPKAACNQFGNYLCQRVIEVCSSEDLKLLVYSLLPSIVDIALNQHGTRPIQILIESLAQCWHSNGTHKFELLSIIAEFENDCLMMCMHSNGNHVVQTFITQFKSSEQPQDTDIEGTETCEQFTDFALQACLTWPVEIGSHKQGCCVMQRCLEKGRLTQKLKLSQVIVANLTDLIEDPYGNYLVQNVLKIRNEEVNKEIFSFIAGDFIRLSKMKFSSNVIEKCLESEACEAKQIASILQGTHRRNDVTLVKLLGKDSREQSKRVRTIVDQLVTHQFGNYVLQKAIFIELEWTLKKQILEGIKTKSSDLLDTKHGSKVLQKLKATYPRIFGGAP